MNRELETRCPLRSEKAPRNHILCNVKIGTIVKTAIATSPPHFF